MARSGFFKFHNALQVACGRKAVPLNKDTAMWWASAIYCRLSPENLSCDGECSRTEVNRKYKELMGALRECEKVMGRPITEAEAYQSTKVEGR